MVATINSDLWSIGIPVLEKAFRTCGVYGGLLVLLRFGGKRDLAQLNSFDLVVLLLLSNVVQNAVIGNDNSLAGGLIGAAILVAVNAVVVRLFRRNETVTRFFEGTPTVLVEAGKILQKNVRRLGLRRSDVEVAIRRQGADQVDQVSKASLEPGGLLLVELFENQQNATRADLLRLEEKLDRLLAAS